MAVTEAFSHLQPAEQLQGAQDTHGGSIEVEAGEESTETECFWKYQRRECPGKDAFTKLTHKIGRKDEGTELGAQGGKKKLTEMLWSMLSQKQPLPAAELLTTRGCSQEPSRVFRSSRKVCSVPLALFIFRSQYSGPSCCSQEALCLCGSSGNGCCPLSFPISRAPPGQGSE